MSADNRLVSIAEAAKLLGITYMEALTDERLKKVRVNRYYHQDTKRLIAQKIEDPGRWPMIRMSDLEVYKLERMAEK